MRLGSEKRPPFRGDRTAVASYIELPLSCEVFCQLSGGLAQRRCQPLEFKRGEPVRGTAERERANRSPRGIRQGGADGGVAEFELIANRSVAPAPDSL